MKLGISSYTFGWAVGVAGSPPEKPWTEIDLLDFAAAHGIGLLQIGDNLPLHEFESQRLDALLNSACARQIQLEVGARRLEVGRVSEYIRIARKLQGTMLRFVIDDVDYQPDPESVVSVLREIEPELSGITLALENHDRFPAQVLRSIIERVGSNHIGICLDSANSLGAGEGIEHVLDHLARHTVNLHIKDFQIERLPYKMGFTVTGRPANDGMLEVEDLLDAVHRFRKCKTAILELWTPPEPTLQKTIEKEASWAIQSLAYLKPLFQHRYG